MSRPDVEEWKNRARQGDILTEAVARGAKLKKVGAEYVGPCPVCGGRDRFSIHARKAIYNCRGMGGGDVISMVMHLDGITFMQACEVLTGERQPGGHSAPLSAGQREARDKAIAAAKARRQASDAEQRAYEENTREAAQRLWTAGKAVQGTPPATYLHNRGLIQFDASVIRFCERLRHPTGSWHPAMLCRVDDVAGNLAAVWRIYLTADGHKAQVAHAKLGLGPAGGGAVRIGGIGPKIGVAEGFESALGFWLLNGRRFPVWAALSTSGMVGLELPMGVEHVCIAPDGDRAMKRKGNEYVQAVPAGRKAALTLRQRLLSDGVGVTIAAEPSAGRDYNDIWLEHMREVA